MIRQKLNFRVKGFVNTYWMVNVIYYSLNRKNKSNVFNLTHVKTQNKKNWKNILLKIISNKPPSIAIIEHNTVKHRTSVRVVFIKTGQHFHLSLKIFSDQFLLLREQNKWIRCFLVTRRQSTFIIKKCLVNDLHKMRGEEGYSPT